MKLSSSKKHEKGQGLVEYSLVLVLVGIVVIGALTVLGPVVGNVFSSINSNLTTAGGSGAGGLLSAAPTEESCTPTTTPCTNAAWIADCGAFNQTAVCTQNGNGCGNTTYTCR